VTVGRVARREPDRSGGARHVNRIAGGDR